MSYQKQDKALQLFNEWLSTSLRKAVRPKTLNKPISVTAYGVRVASRDGSSDSLIEMINFAKIASDAGIIHHVKSIYCHYENDTCEVEIVEGLHRSCIDQLIAVGEMTMNQFDLTVGGNAVCDEVITDHAWLDYEEIDPDRNLYRSGGGL